MHPSRLAVVLFVAALVPLTALAANNRGLVLNSSGGIQQAQDADTLNPGGGLVNSSGALEIDGAGGISLQGGNGVALTVDATGATLTIATGATLTTTGAGNIDLPNNGSARFKIAGSAVSANVTAANLGTLTGGSDGSSLHTHSSTVTTGWTTTAMTASGLFGYVSSASTVTPTDNAAMSTSRAAGIYTGTSGQMVVSGLVTAKLTTAGGTCSAGAPLWLAAASDDTATGAGKLTATLPASGVAAQVALCVDPANYAGAKTAQVLLQVHTPVQL